MLNKRKGGAVIDWGTGMDIYTLLHIKQVTNKDLQGTIPDTLMTCMGIESKEEKRIDICICVTDSFYCTSETNTML